MESHKKVPVERFEALEQELGIEISGVSATAVLDDEPIYYSGDRVEVRGEVIGIGRDLSCDLALLAIVYNQDGDVIGMVNEQMAGGVDAIVQASSFVGIEPFALTIYGLSVVHGPPVRVRVYPRPIQHFLS